MCVANTLCLQIFNSSGHKTSAGHHPLIRLARKTRHGFARAEVRVRDNNTDLPSNLNVIV